MIVFITGGAKNGKSSLAQTLAKNLAGDDPHYYIATMIPADEEDRERIRKHILDRDGMGFETLECGRNLPVCLEKADSSGTFLLDSATALLLNELFPDPVTWALDKGAALRCIAGIRTLAEKVSNLVIVSDYIYSDAEKYDEVTEEYRRGLAAIDKAAAAISDVVIEMTAGIPTYHKGELEAWMIS